MWARSLRTVRSHGGRIVRFRRPYNGQSQGPHTTYFQQPPEPSRRFRRIFRSILISTTCIGLGAYAHAWLLDVPFLGLSILVDGDDLPERELMGAMAAAAQDTAARQVPALDMERAQEYLELRAAYSVTGSAVGHTCQLPSNLPCEDAEHAGVFTVFNDPKRDWSTWAIYDGHAGSRTAQVLKENLALVVGGHLGEANCMDRPYTPNDSHVVQTIKKAFKFVDDEILKEAADRARTGNSDLAHSISALSAAVSGSCALLALFDPARAILRVANTGDSRAVLGRWDMDAGKYVAKPMSYDQTGFNENEVERLRQDHPGEESVDPETGRVHGIMVARAFGDSRWKWPNDLSQLVHDKFWGPKPRPNKAIKTPPYLTAEPEVTETRLQFGQHPDFLIMGSDGLWDVMSSEDAVTCVQQWLAEYKPTKFLEKQPGVNSWSTVFSGKDAESRKPTFTSLADINADEDTYFDEKEKVLKWRVSPKHFVVEDENCGVHLSKHLRSFQTQYMCANVLLVKNALGGKRRNLFCGVMSVQPPLSRDVRDDITVHVVFFGQDPEAAGAK